VITKNRYAVPRPEKYSLCSTPWKPARKRPTSAVDWRSKYAPVAEKNEYARHQDVT